MVTIPCIKGLSKKFKRIGYRFNIKIFKTGNTIGSILRKLNAKKDLLVKP
jgi:DNA-binding CsgD family transcriptional regulator